MKQTIPILVAAYSLAVQPEAFASEAFALCINCGALAEITDSLRLLDEHGVNYLWLEQKGSHEWAVWYEDLYLFSQRLFR